jgi:hypothetical protein
MRAPLACGAAVLAWLCGAPGVSAQSAAGPGGRIIVAAAIPWTASSALGEAVAGLTPSAGQPSYPLFSAAGTIDAHAAGEVGFGYRVSRSLRLSLTAAVARPVVGIRITGDAEGAPDVAFEGERLLQWTIGGRAEYDLGGLRFASGRAVPFVAAGAGASWQLHEGWTAADAGWVIEAGGGLSYQLRSRPASALSRVALAVDVHLTRMAGGVTWDGAARTVPGVRAGLITSWGRAGKAS